MTQSHRRWTAIDLGGDVRPPAGSYSRAVRAAGLLFVSGQVPREFETGRLLGADIESQTRAVMGNLARVLETVGAGLEDVVALTVYLQDTGDWDDFNRVYQELFTEPYPSRTVIGADLRGVLVEVTATAVDPG